MDSGVLCESHPCRAGGGVVRKDQGQPDLETLILLSGSHKTRKSGVCAMEAVAWLAGEEHTDYPRCSCPVIATFVRSWNDLLLDDETRTRLLCPYLKRLVGTRSTRKVEVERSWMALDWLIREYTPAWLDLSPGLAEHAAALRELSSVDSISVSGAQPVVSSAGAAARAAAWDAAGAAAGAAAWDAAGAAARAAAGAAAWDAAGDVVWAAARAAAWDAAWVAARDAAWVAAWVAAGEAAGAAAGDALAPTVIKLQSSACGLLDRMIAVKGES